MLPRPSSLSCGRVALLGRAAGLVTVIGGLLGLVWWATTPAVRDVHAVATGAAPIGEWTLDRLVADVAAGGLLVVTAVLAALVALNLAGAATSRRVERLDRLAARVSPRWLRRCIFACCGLTLSTPGFASVASAHDTNSDGASGQHQVARLQGLRLPDLPAAPPARELTVRPGDSLWSIAERGLPPGSTDAAIAARVDSVYAANRRTIGADPNLIFPGQQLTIPGGAT